MSYYINDIFHTCESLNKMRIINIFAISSQSFVFNECYIHNKILFHLILQILCQTIYTIKFNMKLVYCMNLLYVKLNQNTFNMHHEFLFFNNYKNYTLCLIDLLICSIQIHYILISDLTFK